MSDEPFTIACHECGGEYAPDEEGPEHHEEDCQVREAYINKGRWEDPDA